MQQLISLLNKFMSGQQPQAVVLHPEERTATPPIQAPKDRDATRPSYRITDPKWLKIQKAMDQAG